MELALFKRTGTSGVCVQLFTKWSPFHLGCIVFVYKLRNISSFRVFQLFTIVGICLGHLGSNCQRTCVIFVGNRHNNLIHRFRRAHAWIRYAEFFRFTNLVGVYTRLGVRNVAKVKRNRSISRSSIGLGYLNGCPTVVGPFRHRNANGTFVCIQKEREFIGAVPIAAGKHLFALKNLLARKRARCLIRIHNLCLRGFSCRDCTFKVRSALVESGTLGFADRVVPASGKAVDVQRLVGLQAMLCLAIAIECQGERIALLLSVGVLHNGVECLVRSLWHSYGELERFACKFICAVSIGNLELLRYRKRARKVDGKLAIVAKIGSDLAHGSPFRIQYVFRRFCNVFVFRLIKAIDEGRLARARLEVRTAVIGANGAFNEFSIAALEADGLSCFLNRAGKGACILHLVIRVLIPIGGSLIYFLSALSAGLIGIDRRVFREVVEAVVA